MITVPAWGPVGPFETMWTIAGLVALWFTCAGLVSARRDMKALQQLRRLKQIHDTYYQMLEIVARGHRRNELQRLAVAVLIAGTGAYAMSQPNPLGNQITYSGFATSLALVLIGGLIASRSVWDQRQRAALSDLARERTPRYSGERRKT